MINTEFPSREPQTPVIDAVSAITVFISGALVSIEESSLEVVLGLDTEGLCSPRVGCPCIVDVLVLHVVVVEGEDELVLRPDEPINGASVVTDLVPRTVINQDGSLLRRSPGDGQALVLR